MKNKKIGILSVSLSMVACLFAGSTFASKNELPYADPVSVTDEKIDVTNLKTYFEYNPQDEHYSSQGIALDHVGDIKKVWDKTKGEGTTIAIIDSGIDWTHPDFYDEDGNSKLRMDDARYYAHVKGGSSNWRYPTSGETIYTSDLKFFDTAHSYTIEGKTYSGNDVIRHNGDTSHGTNTASAAASYAHGNTDVGVIGIAPMARILPIKVDMYMDSIGEAFKYIHELNTDSDSTNNVDVVNISICGASTWSTITSGAKSLVGDGTIIVASAGNDNVSIIQYPAGDPNIIGVGALEIDSSTQKASFSNFNPTGTTSSTSNLNVEVTAPGHVYVADYTTYSTYKKTQGTSFSSPIVAGAAALWKSVNKSGTVSQFKTALHNSCADIGSTGWDTTFGYGRLDVGKLVGTTDIVNITSVDLPATAVVGENKTLQLTKTVAPSNVTSKDFRWWSMNERVATVDHNGVVTGHSSGTATIYCKSLANDNIKDTCIVTVAGDIIGVSGMTLTSNSELELQVGKTSQISYTLAPSNATNKNVIYELCEDNGVLQVSSSGLIKALKEGEEIIQITSVDNPNVSQMIMVTVVGSSEPIVDSTTLQFTSKTTYKETGLTNAKIAASGTIQGFDSDRGVQWSKNAATVTISDFPSDVTVTEIDVDISANGTGATATAKIGSSVFGDSYSVGNSNHQTAKFTGSASGSEIVISLTAGSKSTYVLNVTIIYSSSSGESGEDTPPTPTVTFESLSSTGTYTKDYSEGESFNHSKLTIYANYSDGSYKDVTSGVAWSPSTLTTSTTKVTASYTEGEVTKTLDFTGITVHTAIVKVTGISLNKTSLNLEVGDSAILTATITPNNASNKGVVWSSSDNEVATVGNGVVTAVSKGTATIYARSNEDDTIKVTCSVTVTEPQSDTPVPYSGSYYNDVTATSGNALLAELHTLMGNTHKTFTTYDDCKDPTKVYKTDPGSTSSYVTDFYTQHDIGKAWGSGSAGTWNREHVWPQSLSAGLWGETYGGSDLHHLRPVETRLNGTRGNNPFGSVSNRDSYKVYSEKTDDTTKWYHGGYCNNGVFEPLDSVKGDVARILMYVYMQYSNQTGGTDGYVASHTGNILITSVVKAASTNTAQKCWDLLLDWNENDPVSIAEVNRNNEVFILQGNRNPFIDHPEYADAIWGTPKTISVTGVSLDTTSLKLSVGEDATLTATVSPSDATNKNVIWESSDSSVAAVVNGKVTGVKAGTATITVKTADGNKTATCAVTVAEQISGGATYYTKVTNAADLASGDYLIVCEDKNTVLNSSLDSSKIGASGNHIAVTISNNKIESTETVDGYSFTYNASNGSFLSSSGVYIYHSGTSNTLNTSSSAQSNTVSFDADGNALIVCGSYQLCVNSDLYRYYKTSTSSSYFKVQLYKKSSGSVTPTPDKQVVSISLECSTTSLPFELNPGSRTVEATLVATYDDNSTGTITPDSYDYSVNTSVLGEHEIFAIYNGETYTHKIKVTNNGTVVPSDEEVRQNLETSSTTTNLSANSEKKFELGEQISSTTITISFQAALTGTSGTSYSHGVTFKLYDTSGNLLETSSEVKKSVKAYSTGTWTYEFTFDESVIVGWASYTITTKQSGSNLRQRSFDISYAKGSNEFYAEQVKAWSNYFLSLTSPICGANHDGENADSLATDWSLLALEYGYMDSDAKSLFLSSNDSTISAARERYLHIANHYGNSFNFTGAQITSKNAIASLANLGFLEVSKPENTLTIILISLGLISITGYFTFKKKKEF